MKKPFMFALLGILISLAFVASAVTVPTQSVLVSSSLDMQAVFKTADAPAALDFQVPSQAVVSDTIYTVPAVFAPPGSVFQEQLSNAAMTAQSTMTDLSYISPVIALLFGFTAVVALLRKGVFHRFGDGLKRVLSTILLKRIASAGHNAAETLRAVA